MQEQEDESTMPPPPPFPAPTHPPISRHSPKAASANPRVAQQAPKPPPRQRPPPPPPKEASWTKKRAMSIAFQPTQQPEGYDVYMARTQSRQPTVVDGVAVRRMSSIQAVPPKQADTELNDRSAAQCFAVCSVIGACISVFMILFGMLNVVAYRDSQLNNGDLKEAVYGQAIAMIVIGSLIQLLITAISIFRFQRRDAWTNIFALMFWCCGIMGLVFTSVANRGCRARNYVDKSAVCDESVMIQTRNLLFILCLPCLGITFLAGMYKAYRRQEKNMCLSGTGYFFVYLLTPAMLFLLPMIVCMCMMAGGGGEGSGDGSNSISAMFDFGGTEGAEGAADGVGGAGDSAGVMS